MKAIRLKHPAALASLAHVDIPEAAPPGAGEITVALKASSLNFHDYLIATGGMAAADGRIPMSDGAGEVTAVGHGVSAFAVGDAVVSTFFPDWLDGAPPTNGFTRVPGDGIDGYARQAVTVPATHFTRAPRGYSHAEAATLPCAALTAWRALFVDGRCRPGNTVLVQGTGGVSLFALQFAKMAGATVIATSSSDEKLARLGAMGADHLINYRAEQAWGAKTLALTGGRGVDIVVEVGGPATLDQSMSATRVGGHIALIGVLTGVAGPVQTAMLLAKNLRLQGLAVGSRAQQIDMIAAIDANGMKPVINRHFPLAGLADAFAYQESGAHFGKIVVDI